MIKTTTHTLCLVGADEPLRARVGALLEEPRLRSRWRMAERAAAELLLIDTESVYGHMDWLREKANGRLVAACTAQPDAHKHELRLPKPVLAADFVALLNEIGTQLSANAPVAEIPRPAEAAPVVEVAVPPVSNSLLDLLEGAAAAVTPIRLAAAGLPALLLDPSTRSWYAEGGLKSLAGWCTRSIAASEIQPLTPGEFETAAANLPAQPYPRLLWLAHLLRGGGRLDARLDPAARYRLSAWPQSEREFPKHFRIATAMLREAATLEEIAGHSSATQGDVADFINAYHAVGYVEVTAAAPAAESAQRGLFARMRKTSAS